MSILTAKILLGLLLAAAFGFLVARWRCGRYRAVLLRERDGASARARELEAALEQQNRAVADAQADREAAVRRIATLEGQVRAATGFEGAALVLRGRVENLEAELATARGTAEDAARQLARCQDACRAADTRITALTGERQDLGERLAQCEARFGDLSGRLQAGRPPRQYASPPAQVDDLEWIYGVGPKLAAVLQSLGVYQFRQVAAWTDEDIEFFDARLEQFHGRIRRENWVLSAIEEHYKKYGEWLGTGQPAVRMPETGDRPAEGSPPVSD